MVVARVMGIIGGIGPESTIDYYRSMIAACRTHRPERGNPSIVIVSIDMDRMLLALGKGELDVVVDYLTGELERLARAGADIALLASNAPHLVFDELRRQSPLPLISIVDSVLAEARRRGLRRFGLLGARVTMEGGFYQKVFSPNGLEVLMPNDDERVYVHEKYMGELVQGLVVPETRQRMLEIVARMQRDHGLDGLILGGTDLSVMFPDDFVGGIPVLDSTRIHVGAAVAALLE